MENIINNAIFRGLNKTYSNGFQALEDINLQVKCGEIFVLLGSNGAD